MPPRVELYADLDHDGKMDVMMGDNAKASGNAVAFRIRLVGSMPPGAAYTVNVVKNGNVLRTLQMTAPVDGKVVVTEFIDTPAVSGRTYYRVNVEGPPAQYPEVPGSAMLSGNMVGLSNPIYFNFDPSF